MGTDRMTDRGKVGDRRNVTKEETHFCSISPRSIPGLSCALGLPVLTEREKQKDRQRDSRRRNETDKRKRLTSVQFPLEGPGQA